MFDKAVREVCIDNAHPAFGLELILVLFGEKPTQRFFVVTFGPTEPVINKWLMGIVVWRCGTDAIEVDFIENEISHVGNVLSAKIAPEIWGVFHVAVGGVDRTKAVCQTIGPAPRSAAKSFRPPIQVVAVKSVIRMGAWDAADEPFKFIEASTDAVPLGVVIPHPVQGDFEPFVPEMSYEAEILMIL